MPIDKKPSILFLPKWYPHKAEPFDGNFIENHAHAIKRKANVCVLFVHSSSSLSQTYNLEEADNKGILEIRIYFKRSTSVFRKVIHAFRYQKAQKIAYLHLKKNGFKFDLCHVHVLSRSSILALHLLKHENIPFGITEHWSGYLKERNDYHGILKKILTQKAVRKSSFVSTVSTYLMESMKAHQLFGNYYTIPNVVDEKLFQIGKRDPNSVEILFVGNLIQRPKRILDIISVFAELYAEGLSFRLKIYGEGKEENACRQLIQEKQLEKTIQLKGTAKREEIAKQMGRSAFLFLFSDFENQPCVISEAQASGIPVVVPDLKGIKEFMKDDLGLLFPQKNREAFKKACRQMIQNYHTYNRENIRAYALEKFSEEIIAKQFYHAYQQTLSTP